MIQFYEEIPHRLLYFISSLVLIFIIIKIETLRRMKGAQKAAIQLIKNKLTGVDFNNLPEKENDDLYIKFFEIKGLKSFNIIRNNGENLEYKFRDSKDLEENNPKVKNLITKYKDNKNGKILKETAGFIFIHKINNDSFAVLMFSKPNYSKIIFKK